MLWLASLLGMLAVGAVTFTDSSTDEDEAAVEGEEPLGEEQTGQDILTAPDADTSEADDTAPLRHPVFTNQIISGSENDDDLTGSAGDDQINGYGGDDMVSGQGGADDLHGDTGHDTLAGGGGDDHLHGEDGNDVLAGGDGDDALFGHNDNDTLAGGAGQDEMHGGTGDDHLSGGEGADALHGGMDNDWLDGQGGADTLFGGYGDDVISGLASGDEADIDYLNGGDGADTIYAGAGDIVTAGGGLDSILLDALAAQDNAAEIMDFNTAEDSLVMVWDMADAPLPEVEVIADALNPGLNHVFLNGTEVATVYSTTPLDAEDILIIDQPGAFDPVTAAA